MTLMLLWEEYQAEFADRQTYRYTQFCEHSRTFAKRLKRSMRQIHRTGEKLFVDFAGPTLPLTTGRRAHVFAAAMGASSNTFACATPAETMEDWLGGIAHPQLIVPDNPRAMIADPDRYEPRAGDTVLDFARHYGTSFLPPRTYRQALIEDLDTRSGRGIDARVLTSLALGDWVQSGYSLLISGPTGAGKSWLACALAQYACRRGHSALYLRVPRLTEELRILHGNGGFTKWLMQVARVDVLLLDDWGMAPLDAMVHNDLLEMIDDRAAGKATIVTGQLPIEHWHGWIGDETIADAMLDRLMQRHHHITLKGESLRKPALNPQPKEVVLDES